MKAAYFFAILLSLTACSGPVAITGTLPAQSVTLASPGMTTTVATPGGPVSVTVGK